MITGLWMIAHTSQRIVEPKNMYTLELRRRQEVQGFDWTVNFCRKILTIRSFAGNGWQMEKCLAGLKVSLVTSIVLGSGPIQVDYLVFSNGPAAVVVACFLTCVSKTKSNMKFSFKS